MSKADEILQTASRRTVVEVAIALSSVVSDYLGRVVDYNHDKVTREGADKLVDELCDLVTLLECSAMTIPAKAAESAEERGPMPAWTVVVDGKNVGSIFAWVDTEALELAEAYCDAQGIPYRRSSLDVRKDKPRGEGRAA